MTGERTNQAEPGGASRKGVPASQQTREARERVEARIALIEKTGQHGTMPAYWREPLWLHLTADDLAVTNLADDLAKQEGITLARVRERDRLAVRVDELQEALREAKDGLTEAYEYGCRWPIGLDTDPQEQRGMDRDTFLRNTEFFIEQIDAALAPVSDTTAKENER